jgi:exosortase
MSVLIQIYKLERSAGSFPRLFLTFVILLFVGCFGPWLVIHFGHLWRREHYQFFPMMLLAVAVLCYDCWKNAQQQGQSFESLKFSMPLFIMAVLTFAAALWLNSPWLAFFTSIAVLWAILRNLPFGRSSVAPLLVLLPLPFSMDGELVHGLQRVSSRGASALLDLVAIRHLMSGNVLEVADKNFFVEEACSGIGSVYLLLASAAIYGSWRQLRLVVTIPLLVSAVFWAVAGNTFRIFAVAFAHERMQIDLSSGTLHDTLGSATYLMSLLLLIMTEQMLLFLFEPVLLAPDLHDEMNETRQFANVVGGIWNGHTITDPEIRMREWVDAGVSGFRFTRELFIVALLILFSVGCAGNVWRFRSDLLAVSRVAFPSLVPAAFDSPSSIDAAPPSVIAPFLRLKPETISQISGLAFVTPGAGSADVAAEVEQGDSEPVQELPAAELPADDSSEQQRLHWDLLFAETPVLMVIDGPYRLDAPTFSAERNNRRELEESWIVTETSSSVVAQISHDAPLVLEQILKNGPTKFRHELIGEFTQIGSPLPMHKSGSISEIEQQLSEKIQSEGSARAEWYWRVTLRFEADRPPESSVRPSRVAVFGDILKTLLAHWRKQE